MASLLDANLPSEDEEDADYEPGKDEKGAKQNRNGKKRELESGAVEDASQSAAEAILSNIKSRKKKAKVDAVWAQLNAKSTKRKSSDGGTSFSLASLCKEVGKKRSDPDQYWKTALGVSTKKTTKKDASKLQPKGTEDQKKISALSSARSALAAAREATSMTASQRHKTVSVAQTRNFAGQSVKVRKDVPEDSKEALQGQKPVSTTGFDAFLQSIEGKKNVNVLDKTREDWKDYKQGDQKVEEELEKHKRSSNQHLDKVDFLQRSNAREYERERDERLGSDVRTRGRV